jgi:hypothetical protein
MTYKNIELKRRYQREWQQKKRKGLPTALGWKNRILIPPEEKKERTKIYNKKYRINKKLLVIEIINSALGNTCCICNKKDGMPMACHRKDGNKHERLTNIPIYRLKKELESDEYVRLCYACHKAIHWCMENLNMNWNDIISNLQKHS